MRIVAYFFCCTISSVGDYKFTILFLFNKINYKIIDGILIYTLAYCTLFEYSK